MRTVTIIILLLVTAYKLHGQIKVEFGRASYYADSFNGKRTSNGEIYDPHKLTGAHKSLPLNTYVKITVIKTGKSVIVKINDRGVLHDDVIIDLSYAAAKKIGLVEPGVLDVKLEYADPLDSYKVLEDKYH